MSSNKCVIRVRNLSKRYQIYDAPRDRLKQFFMPYLQRLLRLSSKKYFREFWALNDISFEVKSGETIGIIGRNGAGKSTLLQILCGTLTPTQGSVEINGRVAALLELGAGFNVEFTGRENVYLNASVLGLSQAEIDARFDDIVAFADIGDFIDQPVKTYSSGMYVRLAFAVIAHVNADILIIDEALSVGDAFFTQKCMRFLRSFMERGTIIFVSHDTGAVVSLCNHAIWLQGGHLKQAGPPKDISELYLAEQYQSQQGTSNLSINTDREPTKSSLPHPSNFYDMRRDFINSTSLRNDIEIYKFNPDAPAFGAGGAKIVGIYLKDLEEKPLAWIVGGENVKLIVLCSAENRIVNPIIGFSLRDRLGQTLFGDNTFIGAPSITIERNELFQAEFKFQMPILPAGSYSIGTSLAEGTQANHIQHQWIHDALILTSHSSSVSTGLIGIPMQEIKLYVVQETPDQ